MKHTGRTLAAFLLTLALALGLMTGMNLAALGEAASGNDSDIDTPLTLEAKTAGTIIIREPKVGMQYSINGGAKTAVDDTADITINVNQKDTVQFFGKGTEITQYGYVSSTSDPTKITGGDAQCYIYGNIMSLVDENGFSTAKELKAPSAFACLFTDNIMLCNHSTRKLVLPATTLTESCYYYMFAGCTSLTAAPDLPAESLAYGCYAYMFAQCPLTAAPRLDARTLATSCYFGMFLYCEELTAAPVLPAPKLADDCYQDMFRDCKKLKAVTCLATDITNGTPTSWLDGVAATGTFIKAPAMKWPTGVNGIPSGWTAIPSLILKQGEAEVQNLDLTTGSTATLTAVVASNTMDQTVSWVSSDDGIATVVDGVVTAVAPGSATITATSTVESTFSASCVVTVPSTYIITIPATLDVYKAGWNDSEGISASGSLAAGKKLTVTASSDGEFALVNTSDNAEKIRYKLVDVASEDAEYYMTSEKTVWEFTTLWEDAETQSMGVVVEDYSTAAPGSEYIDTVTFTARVEDAP